MLTLFRRARGEQLGPNSEAASSSSILVKDEGRLAELGYAPQLQRDLSFWHNFGISFSIIVRASRPAAASSPLTDHGSAHYRALSRLLPRTEHPKPLLRIPWG